MADTSTADVRGLHCPLADARVRRYEYGRREYGRCEYADASTADAGMDDVSTADASTAGASTADASRMRVGCVRAQEKSNLLRPVASHVQEGAERAPLEGTEGRAGRGSLINQLSVALRFRRSPSPPPPQPATARTTICTPDFNIVGRLGVHCLNKPAAG